MEEIETTDATPVTEDTETHEATPEVEINPTGSEEVGTPEEPTPAPAEPETATE